MKNKSNLIMTALFVLALLFTQGCATKITKPVSAPEPSKVKFSAFSTVEMKHVEVSPKYAENGANQKAAKKIDENLFKNIRAIFPDLKDASTEATPASASKQVLVIEPYVKEIKFIGIGARVMVGSMAGSSAVLMKVTFKDKSTGEVIAEPEFYESASAFSMGYGTADNMMLTKVAEKVSNYTMANR